MLFQADGDPQVSGQAVVGQAAHQQPAPGQPRLGVGGGLPRRLGEGDQHEVGGRGDHLQPEAAELLAQPRPPLPDVLQRAAGEVLVRQGRDRRLLPADRGVERQPDALHRLGDVLRAVGPAHPQGGQAVELGEGVGDDDVLRAAGEVEAVVEGGIGGELRIGAVQHQQHVGAQAGVKRLDLVAPDEGAGRIARVGDEHQPGAVVDRLQHLVDRDAVAGLRRILRLAAAGAGADRIGGEAMLAHDDVVAGLEEHLVEQREHLVGSAAEHQAVGFDPAPLGQDRSQLGGAAVRIDVQAVAGLAIGVAGERAAAQDILVRRQLDRGREPLGLGLAGLVGLDVEDAWLRLRALAPARRYDSVLAHRRVLTRRTGSAQPRSPRSADRARGPGGRRRPDRSRPA